MQVHLVIDFPAILDPLSPQAQEAVGSVVKATTQFPNAWVHEVTERNTYYIGDPCYVLGDHWDECCSLFITGLGPCVEGEFDLKNGCHFAAFNTKYGDGVYIDQHGRTYSVDSGCLAIVPLHFCKSPLPKDAVTQVFDSFPKCERVDSRIYFGSVCIDTASVPAQQDEVEDEADH